MGTFGAAAYNQHQQEQQDPSLLPTPVDGNDVSLNGPVKAIPTPIPTSFPIASEPDSLATTPATSVDKSFLEEAEAATATTSSKPTNGGSTQPFFPRVKRNNTDISVSDLHVPGEYPRISNV